MEKKEKLAQSSIDFKSGENLSVPSYTQAFVNRKDDLTFKIKKDLKQFRYVTIK